MNEVERLVILPPNAAPLHHYNRYYAYDHNGEVHAIYAGQADKPERKWVQDAKSLPKINDGGCGVVNIQFNPKTRKVQAWCNGVA